MQLSVLVPTYCEAASLPALVPAVRAAGRNYDIKIKAFGSSRYRGQGNEEQGSKGVGA